MGHDVPPRQEARLAKARTQIGIGILGISSIFDGWTCARTINVVCRFE